jgi:hypothetical protein
MRSDVQRCETVLRRTMRQARKQVTRSKASEENRSSRKGNCW